MKFYVVSSYWDDTCSDQVKFVVGEFNDKTNASLFARAYNEENCTEAFIVSDYTLLNM